MFAYMPPPPPPSQQHVIAADNPLLQPVADIAFDTVEAGHFLPALQKSFDVIKETLDALTFDESMSAHGFIILMEQLERPTQRVSNIFHLFTGTMDNEALRATADAFDALAIECEHFLSSHHVILSFLEYFKKDTVFEHLSDDEQRIIDLYHRKAFVAGAFLDEAASAVWLEDQKELAQLKNQFKSNINDASKRSFVTVYEEGKLQGLPEEIILSAAKRYSKHQGNSSASEKGPWAFGVDWNTANTVQTKADCSELRKAMFLKTSELGALKPYANQEVIEALVKLRGKLAATLGLDDYNAMSLHTKMAASRDDILSLFAPIRDRAHAAYPSEIEAVQTFAHSLGHQGKLNPWDVSYYADKLSRQRFDIDTEELKAYFNLDHVISVLFEFTQELFGIHITQKVKPAWHEDVRFYEITNDAGQLIASFYYDPFTRIGQKRPGAWMGGLESGIKSDTETLLPLAYMVTNFNQDSVGLSLRNIHTLFHEFGHALQHMLSKQTYMSLSGINGVEWDGVEIASQFMENWIYYKPLLKKLALNVKTGKTLDEPTMDNLIAKRTFMQGSAMRSQIILSTLDLTLYGDYNAERDGTIGDLYFDLIKDSPIKLYGVERHFPCHFSHIFSGGYSAGYYSYLYARIRSSDIFAAFEEAEFEPQAVAKLGKLYKETFLELGGSKDPDEVFLIFRGREPRAEALIRHLGLDS